MTVHEGPLTASFHGHGSKSCSFLKSKFQIGSCKGPINFKPTENVFHVDDIPPVKKAKKKEVLNWKRSKILSLSKPGWNSSSLPELIIPPKHFSSNLVHDRSQAYVYNYRAEVLPSKNLQPLPRSHKFHVTTMTEQTKSQILDGKAHDRVLAGYLKRTEEMPVHPGLSSKKKWQISTVLTKEELRERNAKLAMDSAARSATVKGSLMKYTDPKARYELVLEEIRTKKRQLRAEGPPPEQKKVLFNRLAKEPEAKYKSFHHSGVWEFNKLEGSWMWSDTGSYVKESEGDVVKICDPNRYNFASPC